MPEQKTTSKKAIHALVILLSICGISLMVLRWLYFVPDRILPEDMAWKVTLAGQLAIKKKETLIQTSTPKSKRQYKMISQRFYQPRLKLVSSKPSSAEQLLFIATASGSTELIVEYHIQVTPTAKTKPGTAVKLSSEERTLYLQSDEMMDLSLPSLVQLSDLLRRDVTSKPQLVNKIFHHSQKPLKEKVRRFDKLENTIKANKATTLGRAKLMVALCRANSIPARIVTGFVMVEGTLNTPYYWVEVFDEEDELWLSYDPEKGYAEVVPNSYVTFAYDHPNIFEVENGKLVATHYSIQEDLDILNVTRFSQEKDLLDVFDLRRLDVATRDTLIKILILPFCVLLTAFLRHVFGLFPYGVFTASLLALAMVYAEVHLTLVVSGIVITLALIGRSILPDSLSRSPRLSLIFTFVSLGMVISVSFLAFYSLNPGGNIILLPIIILVSIVDRFYSYMEKSGKQAALLRLGVTVLIALLCIPVLQWEKLGEIILNYPEAHLITAALVLLLSDYKGKKLTDNKYLSLLGENKTRPGSDKEID